MPANGSDFVEGEFGYQSANRLKNHDRGPTVPSSIQPGMLFSRSSDDRLTHKASGQEYLIFQGEILVLENEILFLENEILVWLSI